MTGQTDMQRIQTGTQSRNKALSCSLSSPQLCLSAKLASRFDHERMPKRGLRTVASNDRYILRTCAIELTTEAARSRWMLGGQAPSVVVCVPCNDRRYTS